MLGALLMLGTPSASAAPLFVGSLPGDASSLAKNGEEHQRSSAVAPCSPFARHLAAAARPRAGCPVSLWLVELGRNILARQRRPYGRLEPDMELLRKLAFSENPGSLPIGLFQLDGHLWISEALARGPSIRLGWTAVHEQSTSLR